MREVLDQLDADVAHVDVGDHQDVGPTGDLGVTSDLLGRDVGTYGGVQLELAIDLEVRPAFAGEPDGFAHALDELGLGGAVGGVAQHGHAGFPAQEGADGLGGGDGDGGQLFGVGVDAHGSVAKAQKRSLGTLPTRNVADAQRADDVDAVSQSDDGLPGGDNVAGRTVDAAEGDIRLIRALHHEGTIHRALGMPTDGLGLPGAAGNLLEAAGEGLVGLLIADVYDLDASKVDSDLLGNPMQGLILADQAALGQTGRTQLTDHPHHLGVVALEEGNALGVGGGTCAQGFHQIHGYLLSLLSRSCWGKPPLPREVATRMAGHPLGWPRHARGGNGLGGRASPPSPPRRARRARRRSSSS